MSSTGDGLLHAIVAEPDDEMHRLVYADWLDDQGRPERAEFIRAQVELAHDPTDSPGRRALAWRASQLLAQHEAAWTSGLVGVALEWTFRRGFIEAVAIEPADLDLLTAGELPLRRLAIHAVGEVGALRMLPEENGLVALDLTANGLTNDDAKALPRLPGLAGIRRLSLQFNRLTDDLIGFLTRSAFYRGLDLLRLGANPFTPDGRTYLRQVFGPAVSFVCEREADHLYAFADDRFATGVVEGHRQVFVNWLGGEMLAALFDFEGNLLEIRRRAFVESDETARRQEERSWLAGMGYQPCPVRVKRFRFSADKGVNDFNWWAGAFERDDFEGNDLHAAVRAWVADGQFEWTYGGPLKTVWLDRTGEITDT